MNDVSPVDAAVKRTIVTWMANVSLLGYMMYPWSAGQLSDNLTALLLKPLASIPTLHPA